MNITLTTQSAADTEALAEAIGGELRGGEVIELISDLGGGKTTFTRGLARGAGSKDVVSSPTFTVSKVYKANDLTIYHFDFYRLADSGLIGYELADILGDDRAVVVTEWADVIRDVLPKDVIRIHIQRSEESSREFTLDIPDSKQYIKDVCSDYIN